MPKVIAFGSMNMDLSIDAPRIPAAGETLELTASMTRAFNGLFHFSVAAAAGRKRIAEGSLVLASPKNVAR